MPAEVMARFHSRPDEVGEIDFFEVSRCPLYMVDDLSPHFDPGWLAEVYEAVGTLNLGAPSNWLPSSPSSAFRDAVIMVKSEQEHASAHRAKHEEDW
jgi:hypothetical protein